MDANVCEQKEIKKLRGIYMNKKKAIICTLLFAVVLIVGILGSYFVQKNGISLGRHLSSCITGIWMAECIGKFYNWVRKEN